MRTQGSERRLIWTVQWTVSHGRVGEWHYATPDEAFQAAERLRTAFSKDASVSGRWI